jgi:UPF0755 protein
VRRPLQRILITDAAAVVLAALLCLVAVTVFCQAHSHTSQYIYIVVDRGISFSEIADRFISGGLIRDRIPFLLLGRAFGIEHRAKAGRYRFRATSDMIAILKTLYRGATYRDRVMIRPGGTIERVGRILRERASVDSAAFAGLAYDSAFVMSLGVPSRTAEGYLFPESYDIEWEEGAEAIMRRMVSGFLRFFDDSLRAKSGQLGMSINEVVTLASIIEKEAMLDLERPRISAVFHNRLKRGMRLQADPTVRYALKKWTGRMLYKDLEVDSPFNTYRVYGLPPRPICSPGAASIIAALYPIPGSDELYFVAQGDGTHFFSENARDHQRGKARYKDYLRSLKAETQNATQTNQ